MPDSAEALNVPAATVEADSTLDCAAMTVPSSRWPSALRLVVVVLVVVQVLICWKALPNSLAARVDFRAFYTAGYMLVHGHGPELFTYSVQRQTQNALFSTDFRTLPFLYPAYVAPLFAPFALLRYPFAFLFFLVLNLFCLALAVRSVCGRVDVLKGLPGWLQLGLALAFFPVSMALMQGQISFVLLLIYVGFELLLQNQKHWLAGVVLAFGLVKFQLALPIALLFLAWGFYRVIAGFLAGGLALGAASFVVSGTRGMAEYWHNTAAMAGKTLLDPAAAKLRYGMFAGDMPNLHGFFFTLTHGRLWGTLLAAAASVAVMFWAWRQRPSVAVALPAAMLVSYHMQAYDLVLLLLPLALVLPARTRANKLLLIVGVALLTAPIAAVFVAEGLSSMMMPAVLCVLMAARAAQNPVGPFVLIDEQRSYS